MTEIEIFAACLGLGMTAAGAAGCTANILAESAGRPDNVEDSFNRKLGVSDAEYVRQIDAGTRDFLSPAGGFGLCQWTSKNRREALLDYAKGKGVSIADAGMQFQFMAREMRQSYSYVWSILTHTDSPYEAGYTMCAKYEIPANTEATAKVRGSRAEEIYRRCAGTEPAVDPGEDEPKPTTEFWPPRMLCKGMTGPDVSALQAILTARGYSVLTISGVFDESTEKAVRRFQEDHGLDVDGVVGMGQTWPALLEVKR